MGILIPVGTVRGIFASVAKFVEKERKNRQSDETVEVPVSQHGESEPHEYDHVHRYYIIA